MASSLHGQEDVVVSEDRVVYRVYPLSVPASTDAWLRLRDQCLRIAEEILAPKDAQSTPFIWQNEPFALDVREDANPPHLYGSTAFGDNIEDEWLVVYLLREISRSLPDVVISVCDNDGDFLLIEAADVLPAWLDPDTSANRLFLKSGRLHLVPLPDSPATIGIFPIGQPSLSQSLALFQSSHNLAIMQAAARGIQAVIDDRIAIYPRYITESRHRAVCFLPAAIFHILREEPQLVAPAVTAFYQRDPIDMRACTKMPHFPPNSRCTGTVNFTRCLYAQLSHQRFHPPECFGRAPPQPGSKDQRAFDLGAKLACGFQILAARGEKLARRAEDPTAHPKWPAFLRSLQAKGYFQDNIEGSKDYQRLLQRAKEHFSSLRAQLDENESAWSTQDLAAERILRMMNTWKESGFNPVTADENQHFEQVDDSDEWMNMTADQFESLLKARFGDFPDPSSQTPRGGDESAKHTNSTDQLSKNEQQQQPQQQPPQSQQSQPGSKTNFVQKPTTQAEDLEEVAKKMSSFLKYMSSHEGAEIPDKDFFSAANGFPLDEADFGSGGASSEEEGSGDEDGEDFIHSTGDKATPSDLPVSFDGDSFIGMLQGLLGNLQDLTKDLPEDAKVHTTSRSRAKQEVPEPEAESLRTVMAEMDEELRQSAVGESIAPAPAPAAQQQVASAETPVSLDMNVVKNLLESFVSQHGVAGPVSNLLGSMNAQLSKSS